MRVKFLALLCALSLLLTMTTSAVSDPLALSGDTLYTLGLLDSPAQSYDLAAAPTRINGVLLLVALSGGDASTAPSASFSDVPSWGQSAVNYATAQGWVQGTSATTFGVYSPLSANAYCTMVLRMLGYDDQSGDFDLSSAALFAQRLGVLRNDVIPTGDLTVGDLFDISLELLSVTYKDSQETVLDRLLSTSSVSSGVVNALGLGSAVLTTRQIADRYSAAVVGIECYYSEKAVEKEDADADATAFFISEDGLAVTNYHSIQSAIYATATLSTGEVVALERVLFYDADIDIAVVQMEKPTADARFSYFEILSRDTLEVGDPCTTISNPLGLGISVTNGVISALARHANGYALDCIISTADISQGSSGGALINQYGQAVGVTAGAYTYGNSMYLGVPLDPVLEADLTVEGWTLPQLVELEDSSLDD